MTERQNGTRGFGYQPQRSAGYHFEVRHAANGGVSVWERLGASGDGDGSSRPVAPKERARLNAHRWELVQSTVANEFNVRLRQSRIKPGRWLKQVTPLAPHFGKELVLLIWAIDDQDPTLVPRMLANWRGLAPEERWWFYTTINASARARAGDERYGWKAAIKIAFLDDPQDLGLESLRIASERRSSEDYDVEASGENPAQRRNNETKEGPTQGRLFAEPDAPGY